MKSGIKGLASHYNDKTGIGLKVLLVWQSCTLRDYSPIKQKDAVNVTWGAELDAPRTE